MLDPRAPAPIWLIWTYLSLLERLSFLALCLLGVYSFFVAATVLRVRNVTPVQEKLMRVRKRVRNLQQTTVAAFYFFGFVLFAGFQSAYFSIDDGNIPVGLSIIRSFQVHFAFADNVFLILLVFHFVQWFVANRVAALCLPPNS